MLGLLKDFLESQSYQVSCYASAAMAIKFLRDGTPVDAVVADIRMRPIDGIAFLEMVKNHVPALPVFLFTAAGSNEERARSLKLGASMYLFKPFPLADLKMWLDVELTKPVS